MLTLPRFLRVSLGILCCVAASGCKARPAPTESRPPGSYQIVTTCGMVTDITQHVAGDKARVVGLMGEGVDPHLYRPTRDDVKLLSESQVIIYSGLLLEGRMADLFTKMARNRPVYAVTEQVAEEVDFLLHPAETEGHPDPHVWMDVAAWSRCTQRVAQALGEYDPENAAYYQANADAYQAELLQLDRYVQQVIDSIPEKQRVLITAHDAFGYFSRAYHIPVMSIQGISTESEAGVNDINRLVDAIVGRKIQAVFVETSVSKKNIQAVIEGCADRGWTVQIGGELYSDAMGPPDTYEGTYLGMMDHNATVIARSLGGEAPPAGFQGKLTHGKNPESATE
jgi:manganese/zinc/iron transport system substrate-binding protein